MRLEYVESEKRTVQGKFPDMVKRYGKEYKIKPLGKGNGNWLLTTKNNVLYNGKKCKGFVLDYYGSSKLTMKLFERFSNDVENGLITEEMIDDYYSKYR